jgi:hypothetical protein
VAHSTSQTAFLTIEKSFTYKGAREHWSNAYHLDQVPSSQSQWQALATEVVNFEQAFMPADVQFEHYYGHEPGTPPILVWEFDEAPAGEGGAAGSWVPGPSYPPCPGDAAGWVRYGTTQKNTLGKPIYLRNYYHAIHHDATPDKVSVQQATLMGQLATAWVNGIAAGGTTFRRAGPRGAVAQNHVVGEFITTRTLKHRGRRHRWSPTAAPTGYKWILTNVPESIN